MQELQLGFRMIRARSGENFIWSPSWGPRLYYRQECKTVVPKGEEYVTESLETGGIGSSLLTYSTEQPGQPTSRSTGTIHNHKPCLTREWRKETGGKFSSDYLQMWIVFSILWVFHLFSVPYFCGEADGGCAFTKISFQTNWICLVTDCICFCRHCSAVCWYPCVHLATTYCSFWQIVFSFTAYMSIEENVLWTTFNFKQCLAECFRYSSCLLTFDSCLYEVDSVRNTR